MPTVPLVRERTVQSGGLPSARVNTNAPLAAFGGGAALEDTANAARGMASDVQRFAIKQAQDADEIRLQAADLDMSKAQTDIQIQLKNMQGKDALNAPDYVNKEWKDRTDKIYEGLSTQNQRDQFNRIRSVRSADLYGATQNHVAIESKKYDAELTGAYIKNTQNAAATNFMSTDPGGQVEQSIFQQEAAIKKFGARNGIPNELLDQKIASAKSETYSSVIEQMLSNHADQLAAEYYKEKKDYILADDRVKLEKAIEAGVLLGDGQRQADQIFTKFSGDRNRAFQYVKDHVKDPELRKSTETQLESMFTRQSIAQREMNYKNYQLASQLVEQNQTPPGNLTANLTATQNAALKARQKQINARVQPETDWTAYYDLKTMAANNKNNFLKENLLEYRHVLADAEFKDLTNLQGQLSKSDATVQTQLNGYRTTTQTVNDALLSAGININSKKMDDQKKVAQFRRMVDEHIQILQDQTGKKAKSEDVQKITDNLLINAIDTKKGFFGFMGRQVKTFELQYKDVPSADRSAIISELKKRGRPATERSILEYYVRGLEFKRNKNAY